MYIYDILFFSPLPCNFLQDSLSNVYRWAVNYKEACFQKAKLKETLLERSFQQNTGKSLILTLLTSSELTGFFFIHTNTHPIFCCYIEPTVI